MKRIRKLAPTIIAGIIWGVLWYYFDNKLFHAFTIAVIWSDKQFISNQLKGK